jgi:hypothetical protein
MRSLMHNNGIQWIKNINRDIDCNLSNKSQLIELKDIAKTIYHDSDNTGFSPSLPEVFSEMKTFAYTKTFQLTSLYS